MKTYYYMEQLPLDCIENMSDDEIFNHAMEAIKERQKFYRIPANWILRKIDHETGKVYIKYQSN